MSRKPDETTVALIDAEALAVEALLTIICRTKAVINIRYGAEKLPNYSVPVFLERDSDSNAVRVDFPV